jgi:FixJ family two-component response regulator
LAGGRVWARHEELRMLARPLVTIVDDDQSVRESLPDLIGELGYACCAFPSAADFLGSDCVARTACLILDVAMPGMSGFDLQQELARRGHGAPIIFITANCDHALRRRALDAGAVECLFKPFSDIALRLALGAAVPIGE